MGPLTRFIIPKEVLERPKSDWLRDFEAYLASEKAKPRIQLVTSKPKPVTISRQRICSVCAALICGRNASGKCQTCYSASYIPKITFKPAPRHCALCNKVIRRHAELDLCREHGRAERRKVQRERSRLRMQRRRAA